MSESSSKRVFRLRTIPVSIFRFLWALFKTVKTIFFGLIALFVISALVFAAIERKPSSFVDGSALLINPSGALVEQLTEVDPLAQLQGNAPRQALVKDIVEALELAKVDPKIGVVVLDLDFLRRGLLPALQQIVSAIIDFKASDKKVIAIANNYSQSALYIAAHADEVLLNPEGSAVPYGFAMYRSYFSSLLEKLDVTVNLFKVGKYKSATEPFVRDDMSDEDREARQVILDSWWQSYTDDIESARGMDAGSIDASLESAADVVRQAEGRLSELSQSLGFVDRLLTSSERRRYLIEQSGEDQDSSSYQSVSYRRYLQLARKPVEHTGSKIAVITAVGNIVDGKAPAGTIGSASVVPLIRKARLDNDVKAIVLRVDSGGGSKSASEMIRAELTEAQNSGIPVVASFGSIAASGGYWVAASADRIWASANTVTGSIGIYGVLPTFENTLARYGVFSDGLGTSPIAGTVSLERALSPEYADILQTIVDAGYQQFLEVVSAGRGMTVEQVHEVAQGRIWTGEIAQQIGLVDQLGGEREAIEDAAMLADTQDYTVWHVKPRSSLQQQLISRLTSYVAHNLNANDHFNGDSVVAHLIRRVRGELEQLSWLNDPGHIYVICGDCPDAIN